jgi:hypothetical protein
MSTLTESELAYLASWAREEQKAECWTLPAHRLQAIHKVSGITFVRLIKAWAHQSHRNDEAIYAIPPSGRVSWPWPTPSALDQRLAELLNVSSA